MLRAPWVCLPMFVTAMLVLLTSGCGTSSTFAITPTAITIVVTVPVEVTRRVEVTRLVEVTRQVVVTQLVEVHVTPEPAAFTGLPSAVLPTETPMPTKTVELLTPQPTLLSTAKIGGSTTPKSSSSVPFFIENQTDETLAFNLYGPQLLLTLNLGKDEVRKTFLQEGSYTYEVLREGLRLYSGEFTINNIDKHEFLLREDKAVLWIP